MKNIGWLIFGVAGLLLTSCSADEDKGLSFLTNNYDFSTASHGWEVDFANYRIPELQDDSSRYKFSSSYTELPTSANLGPRKAIKVSGNNVDGKLLMYLRKKVSGFQPNTDYTVGLEVEFASSARADQSEGRDVALNVGAFNFEPQKVISKNNYILDVNEPNYYAGNTNMGGMMLRLGNIGTTPLGNDFSDKYSLVVQSTLGHSPAFQIRSNSNGEIWLIVGTESNYIGMTTLYYTRISYVFSVSN